MSIATTHIVRRPSADRLVMGDHVKAFGRWGTITSRENVFAQPTLIRFTIVDEETGEDYVKLFGRDEAVSAAFAGDLT